MMAHKRDKTAASLYLATLELNGAGKDARRRVRLDVALSDLKVQCCAVSLTVEETLKKMEGQPFEKVMKLAVVPFKALEKVLLAAYDMVSDVKSGDQWEYTETSIAEDCKTTLFWIAEHLVHRSYDTPCNAMLKLTTKYEKTVKDKEAQTLEIIAGTPSKRLDSIRADVFDSKFCKEVSNNALFMKKFTTELEKVNKACFKFGFKMAVDCTIESSAYHLAQTCQVEMDKIQRFNDMIDALNMVCMRWYPISGESPKTKDNKIAELREYSQKIF